MFCLAALCRGQADPDPAWTAQFPNGRFWNTSNEGQRLHYLTGVRDAAFLSDRKTEWMAKGFTIGDYLKEIDKVFSEGENLNIPVVWVFRYCTNKLNGDLTKENQERVLGSLRLMARDVLLKGKDAQHQ
jgi:hypothetical protein